MGERTVGTPRSLSLEGISYSLAADVNLSENPSQYANERIPTSGKSMRKMTKRVPSVESCVLIVTPREKDAIGSLADNPDDIKMNYVYANNQTSRATGSIDIDSYETEDGRLTLRLDPEENWTLYT